DGRMIDFTDKAVPKEFRETMRQSACSRFTTVLGPGADSYHESVIHLDLIERQSGYRLCQWDVLTAPEVPSEPVPAERRGAVTSRTDENNATATTCPRAARTAPHRTGRAVEDGSTPDPRARRA